MYFPKKQICLTILLFLLAPLNFAQNPKEFDSIYRKIFLEVSQKDYEKSKILADSLYRTSSTPLYKTKSLMLMASICQQGGEIKEAVNHALAAENHLQNTHEWDWEARVYGFLATQYRHLKLLKQSENYIEKTLQITEKIGHPEKKNYLLGFVYQEKAYHEIDKKNFSLSIEYLQKSQNYFRETSVQDKIVSTTNLQLLGLNYYYLKDYKKAYETYFQALRELEGYEETYLYSLVNNGLANLYLEEDKVSEAEPYVFAAYKFSKKSTFLSLQNEVLKTLDKYYIKNNELDKLKEIRFKRDSVLGIINKNSYAFLDDAFTGLNQSKIEKEKTTKELAMTVFFTSCLFIMAFVYILYYRKKKKREYNQVQNLMYEMEMKLAQSNFTNWEVSSLEEEKISIENSEPLMPAESEQELIQKLIEFEKSKLYLKKNVSLPMVASKLDTNIKYLSYVVNKHKGMDFSNYVKELKILYILKKLDNDPQYLLYKISALSEETGFSSQSKFASAFKKVTKVSPSTYIQYLKEKAELVESN